ncbi:hypothetical protein D0T50_01955 [Bacteroides sp. 214]|uniref:hypothetical protein n=1 Tax=Bacteroides sp. 214 TaxID=2302935 RepID=UPI0013D41F80|nr:hypothetical protein [Bacteroides sp. 214]NDW11651.1 hypothetical protein [Bacteroides sp. 214]
MKKLAPSFYVIGGIMLLVGAATYITEWFYSSYIYLIGATLFALAQVNMGYQGKNKNLKRLYGQQLLGALFLVAAGVFMFFGKQNEWILMLTIGGVFQLYTAFRIPAVEKKDKET